MPRPFDPCGALRRSSIRTHVTASTRMGPAARPDGTCRTSGTRPHGLMLEENAERRVAPTVRLETDTLIGNPAPRLLAAAEDAELLVVRAVRSGDRPDITALYADASPESLRLRFFVNPSSGT